MHIYGKNPFIFFCRTWLTTLLYSFGNVSKGAKIRNRYNQVPHLTQDTNGKMTNSQQDTTQDSQEVSPFPVGDHKANLGMYEKLSAKAVKRKTKMADKVDVDLASP